MKKKNINLLFWKLQKKKLEIERFKLKNYSNYFPIFLLFLLNLKKIFSTFFIIFIMFCVHASRILVISIIAIYTWIWETLFNTNWISNTLIAKKKKNLLFEKKKRNYQRNAFRMFHWSVSMSASTITKILKTICTLGTPTFLKKIINNLN